MKEHFKKYWPYALFIAIIIFLLYLLLSGPSVIDSHKTEHDQLAAANKELTEKLDLADRKDKIDRSVIVSQDSAIRAIRTQQAITRHDLDKTKAIANRLAVEVKQLQPEDTSLYAHKVDSLVEHTEDLTYLIHEYEGLTDSLNTEVETQKTKYEDMIAAKVKLNSELRVDYTKLNSSYEGLFKDYGKVSKQLKREKLKTKIAGILGLAAIGFMIAK